MQPKLRDSRITFEDIATFPRPGCSAPDSIAFSPDDSVVTYLASADGSLTRQLYAMDIVSGEVRLLILVPSQLPPFPLYSLPTIQPRISPPVLQPLNCLPRRTITTVC
jgi:hypothetical protein